MTSQFMTADDLISIVRKAEQPLLPFADEQLIARIRADISPIFTTILSTLMEQAHQPSASDSDVMASLLPASIDFKNKLGCWTSAMPATRIRAFGISLLQQIFKEDFEKGDYTDEFKEKALRVWAARMMEVYRDSKERYDQMGWIF